MQASNFLKTAWFSKWFYFCQKQLRSKNVITFQKKSKMESKKILLVTKKSPVTKESPLVKESPVTKESPIAKASAVAREPSTSNSLPSTSNSSATVPINPSASVANSSASVPIIPSASVPINPPLIPAGRRVAARRSQPPVRSWLRTLRPRPMVDGSKAGHRSQVRNWLRDLRPRKWNHKEVHPVCWPENLFSKI